jgi:hypothetical protein
VDGLHNYQTLYSWAGRCDDGRYCQPTEAASRACLLGSVNFNAPPAYGDGAGCEVCATGACHVDELGHGAVTTIWDWLVQLNASNFAGHNDWRIPTYGGLLRPSELETILYYDPAVCGRVPKPPCVSAAFNNKCDSGGSCTGQAPPGATGPGGRAYWSATKDRAGFAVAIGVGFGPSGSLPLLWRYGDYVRAVRTAP